MVGKVKFRADPALGAIGLYRDPNNNNEALADPLSHIDKVIFHPALRYCGIIATITGTLSLPATTVTGLANEIVEIHMHTLAAHGQSGKPMILGVIKSHPISGADVAWCGSIPIQQLSTDPTNINSAVTRWVTLGIDGTNLVAREQRPRPRSSGGTVVLGAVAFNYEIHIFDVDLESALPSGSGTSISNASGVMEIVTPKGVFSMSRRYLKAVNSGGLIVPGGKTINSLTNPQDQVTWQCSHGAGGLDVGHYRWDNALGSFPPSAWAVTAERVTS